MFDAKQLLDQILQSRPSSDTQPRPSGSGDSLSAKQTLQSVLSGAGGGFLAGLLTSNKTVRRLGGKMVSYGGAAALGALALTAYQNWQASQAAAASGSTPKNVTPDAMALSFDQMSDAQTETQSRAMLAAMIAAAKADGQFDERERQLIREQVSQVGDPEIFRWVQAQINQPLNLDELASMATTPEIASEMYLVSLIVMEEQNPMEKLFLAQLADKLKLAPELRTGIERQLIASAGV